MQKQLRIISQNQISICKFGKSFSKKSGISKIAYSRHLGRVPVYYRPLPFVTVRLLPCGWFVFRLKSGRRILSPLPF